MTGRASMSKVHTQVRAASKACANGRASWVLNWISPVTNTERVCAFGCREYRRRTDVAELTSRRIASKEEIAIFHRHMAGITSPDIYVGGLAAAELCVSPATGRRVVLRVLDHELDVRWRARDKRLSTTKDSIVFFRWHIAPCDPGNDRAVRKWQLSFTIGFDCNVIAENRTYVVELAFFVSD